MEDKYEAICGLHIMISKYHKEACQSRYSLVKVSVCFNYCYGWCSYVTLYFLSSEQNSPVDCSIYLPDMLFHRLSLHSVWLFWLFFSFNLVFLLWSFWKYFHPGTFFSSKHPSFWMLVLLTIIVIVAIGIMSPPH